MPMLSGKTTDYSVKKGLFFVKGKLMYLSEIRL